SCARTHPMARSAYHHARPARRNKSSAISRAQRDRSSGRLRLVQRVKVAGKEAYLIGKRADHEQHLEFYIARYRGDAAEHDEYADRRKILWPKGLQMRVT